MPIPVACKCGRQFNAPDKYAGKRVKCPGCGGPLDVPAPQRGGGISDALREEGMAGQARCPNCKADLTSPDAVLCLSCGYNLETGQQVRGVAVRSGGHKGEAERLLQKAEEELEDVPVRAESAYGHPSSAWVMLAVLVGVVGGVMAGAVAFFTYMEKKSEEEKQKNKGSQVRVERPTWL